MAVDFEKVEDVFTYHPPESQDQLDAYNQIREAAKAFVYVILRNTPICADQQAAIRLVREGVMTANAAVALKGLV